MSLSTARFLGSCLRCGRPIKPGTPIDVDPARGTICAVCSRQAEAQEEQARRDGEKRLAECGTSSGLFWDHGVIARATNLGIVAQYREDGCNVSVEKYRVGDVPVMVKTVFVNTWGGGRKEYLYAPQNILAKAAPDRPRKPKPASALHPTQQALEFVEKARKAKPAQVQAVATPKPAPAPTTTVVAPQTPVQPDPAAPPVVPTATREPKATPDPKFVSPPPPKVTLVASSGITIQLDKPSGLFYVSLPLGADAARGALKGAGFHFHWGVGNDKCWKKCQGCKAFLPDFCYFTHDTRAAGRFMAHLSPDARQAVEGVKKAVEESQAESADIQVPAPAGLVYRPYQLAGVKWCLERKNVLLSDEPGLGKTIQVLGLVNFEKSIKRVLVIAPATLLYNWRAEAKRWLVDKAEIAVLGDAKDLPGGDRVFAITNYEMLVGRRGGNLHGALLEQSWDLIVLDEAHRVSNENAKVTQATLGISEQDLDDGTHAPRIPGLVDQAKRRIFLSGTPFKNRPREMWALLNTLDPVHFNSAGGFMMRYCGAEEIKVGKKTFHRFDGSSHLEELQDRLRGKSNFGRGLMLRRLKEDVLPELPPKIRQIIALPVPKSAAHLINAQWKIYAQDACEVEGKIAQAQMCGARNLGEEYSEAVGRMEKAAEVAFNRLAEERHAVGLAKVPAALEHITGMLDDGLESLVVFAHHHDVIEKLMEGLARFNPVKMTGKESKAQRHAAVEQFQNDKNCRVIVANIITGGEGITLTRASTVCFVEQSYVPSQLTQGEDRLHRIGQASSVLVLYLVFDGSLDQRMAEVLVEKASAASAALDPKHAQSEANHQAYADGIKSAALNALNVIAEKKSNGSKKKGGFSQAWIGVGSWLAAQNKLSNRQCGLALKCLSFHQEQLPAHLLAPLQLQKKAGRRSPNQGEQPCVESSS